MNEKYIGSFKVWVGIALTLLMCKGIDAIFYAHLDERISDWQAIALGTILIIGSMWAYLTIILTL